jgi:glyoxylase-like metal-dependent hydrolase (beta-lactamase superfamily II)
MVVISHCHGDHVNRLLDGNNKIAFPNAEVLVPASESLRLAGAIAASVRPTVRTN